MGRGRVDEFRARRKELGDWPDRCFLPLAGTSAIVSKGKTLRPEHQAHRVGVLGALAAWRVTQVVYRFDPTTFDALWATPVTGDIPTEVLFHLPEWCTYIPTPGRTWQGSALHGFFARLESDMNDRRTCNRRSGNRRRCSTTGRSSGSCRRSWPKV